jgi:hypothetical protein
VAELVKFNSELATAIGDIQKALTTNKTIKRMKIRWIIMKNDEKEVWSKV